MKTAKFDQEKASSSIHNIWCDASENTCKHSAGRRIYDSIFNVGNAKAILYNGYHDRGVGWAYSVSRKERLVIKMISFSGPFMDRRYYYVFVFG